MMKVMMPEPDCDDQVGQLNIMVGGDDSDHSELENENNTSGDNTQTIGDETYRRELIQLFRQLRQQAYYGMKYYDGTEGVTNHRFFNAYCQLMSHLTGGIESGVDYLLQIAHLFDYDRDVSGNGYRSITTVIERCCLHLMSLCRHARLNRESYLFRADHYGKELEAYVTTLGQLRACLYYLRKLSTYCRAGELFADEESLNPEQYGVAERLMMEVESLCQESFYGRCLGFQFCTSMVAPLKTINLVMASYGDGYNSKSPHGIVRLATSVLSSGKYLMNPELRAKQVVNMTRNSDIHFCKAFWALGENVLMHLETVKAAPSNVRKPSPCLIIHCHGGGFVAQSSASHEVYLRQWAMDLDVPILSVDYSLAPQHQFPRQMEEVFFAYCWALNNAHLLGSTAERVCLVGDSAGGNLVVSVAMRAAACGIRPPTGVVSIYGCLLVKYAPSPSRILALMDPLVPIGALSMCLGAYAGLSSDNNVLISHDSLALSANFGQQAPNGPYIHIPTSEHHKLPDLEVNSTGNAAQDCSMPYQKPNLTAQTGSRKLHHASGDSGVFDASDELLACNNLVPSGPQPDQINSNTNKYQSRLDHSVRSDQIKGSLSKSVSMPACFTAAVIDAIPLRMDASFSDLTKFARLRHFAQSPMLQSKRVQVSRSPYMSQFLAPNELLLGLPPVHLIACHLDPMLDDSVMFARRLRSLGRSVYLHILPDLPHGFLNFVLCSTEAKLGSDQCVSAIRNVLSITDAL